MHAGWWSHGRTAAGRDGHGGQTGRNETAAQGVRPTCHTCHSRCDTLRTPLEAGREAWGVGRSTACEAFEITRDVRRDHAGGEKGEGDTRRWCLDHARPLPTARRVSSRNEHATRDLARAVAIRWLVPWR